MKVNNLLLQLADVRPVEMKIQKQRSAQLSVPRRAAVNKIDFIDYKLLPLPRIYVPTIIGTRCETYGQVARLFGKGRARLDTYYR